MNPNHTQSGRDQQRIEVTFGDTEVQFGSRGLALTNSFDNLAVSHGMCALP